MKAARGRHLSARQRPRSRARDLRVDLAVDEVVIGAARAAHGDGADREQEQQPRIGIGLLEASLRQRHRPEAGEGQQEEADRAVEAGEPR